MPQRKRTKYANKSAAREAWLLLKKKGWKVADYKALGAEYSWVYISPDFEQTKLGEVVCKASGAPGKIYQDYFFVERDAPEAAVKNGIHSSLGITLTQKSAGIDRIVTPKATVKKVKCSTLGITLTQKSTASELQTKAKRKRTKYTNKLAAREAWLLLKKKGWKVADYKALGAEYSWVYISPDFEQTKLGEVVCKASGAPGKICQDYFFVERDAKKALLHTSSPEPCDAPPPKNEVLRKKMELFTPGGADEDRQSITLPVAAATSSKTMGEQHINVRKQRSSYDSKPKPSIEETDKGGQGIPYPISPLPHALSTNDDNSIDEDAWMVDIPGLRSLDPDASDFVYEHNAYVWHHEQFYRSSSHSEKEEEDDESDGMESLKAKQMGEGGTYDKQSMGRKLSLKERRSRNTVSDYSWAEVWDYLCKKHQWSWIRSPSDLILKGSWVYLRAGVIRGHPGRGAPPIITAGTLEPAKEGLHFFMNPQDVMEYIEEKAHPDIKFGLHEHKEGKVVFCGGPCHPWINEPQHGGPTLHDYEGHLSKFLKDKEWSPAGTRRDYREYLLQDNLNRSWGAIASGADRYFKRRSSSNVKHGLTGRRSGSAAKYQPRRRNKYASVTSVNTETNAIVVASKEPPLSREEKRAVAKSKHEEEYPPPIHVSSNRAFELVSSLPQANEDYVALLHLQHATKFPLWRSTLRFGWGLGLCGAGSKIQLLDDFVRRELSREANSTKALTVRAFMGSNISFILTSLCRCAMGQATADTTIRSDPIEHADTILAAYDKSLKRQGLNPQRDDEITGLPTHNGEVREFLENTGKGGPNEILATVKGGKQGIRTTQMRECALRSGLTAAVPPRIFLAIHNIDAEQLRDRSSQEALGMVAKHPRIHLIATADHVNAALLWDDEFCGPGFFRWQWEYAPTHRRYDEELRYVSGTDISSTAKMAHGLSFVLESLTNKHLIIAKTLARAILKMGPEVQQVDRGMGVQDLFDICRNELFLQRAQNLTPYIKVLEDNNIVTFGSHRTYGPQWLTMPQPREALLCIDKFGQVGG
eukprot:542381_1